MHLQARHPTHLLALLCWNSLSGVHLPSSASAGGRNSAARAHATGSCPSNCPGSQLIEMTPVSCARTAPAHAAAIGWLEDGRRHGPMDSADLLRAERRGTCGTGGGGACQRCARVGASGACSPSAGGEVGSSRSGGRRPGPSYRSLPSPPRGSPEIHSAAHLPISP